MPIEEKPKIAVPESLLEPEKLPEMPQEAPVKERVERAPIPETAAPAVMPAPAPSAPLPFPKEPLLMEIESVLEEDLQEVYAGLPEALKPKFKAQGEETARAIHIMIASAKVKARRVLKFIREWLKLIPGVNRFFLEQETAIKAQKILTMAKEKK